VADDEIDPRIEDRTYEHDAFPRALEIQVLAFMRIVWADGFTKEERHRSRMWDIPPPVHFVRVIGDLLVSHASFLPLEFDDGRGGRVRVAGVGAVMTYPQFRGEGHASAVMRRAAAHIAATADVGVLFCDESNVPFYERLGWVSLAPGRVIVAGAVRDDVVMALGDASVLPDPLRTDHAW
jgi:GNAT superfamily N-acetyltransferase